MIGVSKTFGGSSILSSPALKTPSLRCFFYVVLHFVLHTIKIINCYIPHFLFRFLKSMSVHIFQYSIISPSASLHDISIRYSKRMLYACRVVPLRYNNDKQKKPLFSRGLSVCRLLFNSFSKLKIDENYKEKRRLFY